MLFWNYLGLHLLQRNALTFQVSYYKSRSNICSTREAAKSNDVCMRSLSCKTWQHRGSWTYMTAKSQIPSYIISVPLLSFLEYIRKLWCKTTCTLVLNCYRYNNFSLWCWSKSHSHCTLVSNFPSWHAVPQICPHVPASQGFHTSLTPMDSTHPASGWSGKAFGLAPLTPSTRIAYELDLEWSETITNTCTKLLKSLAAISLHPVLTGIWTCPPHISMRHFKTTLTIALFPDEKRFTLSSLSY